MRQPPFAQIGRSRVPLHRRLFIIRSAIAYWIAVALLASTTALSVMRLMNDASATERRFGPVRHVLVATVAIRAGQRLTRTNTALEARPVAQLPAGVLDKVPLGTPVAGPIARHEVLTRDRLRAGSTMQPSGTATIAVSAGEVPLAVRPGDRIDLYATYDPALTPAGTDATSRVATRAEVVRASRTSVTLRVSEADAPAVAGAVARATVTVALVR